MSFTSKVFLHLQEQVKDRVHNMFTIHRNKSLVYFTGLKFSACKNRYTPRTSQPARFDISAFIVSTYHTHNVEKFAARTAPGNCPHSTGHNT
jgi:hypothetical protein